MYATGNKKMLNMLILDILRVYTDESHHLTQQEIVKLLKQNYDMECDRRSIRNNVDCLVELGYDILYDKGYWLAEREFEDAELRMLIDSVLSSRNLTNHQAKTLIGKLENLTSKYFSPKVTHICNAETNTRTDNKQVLVTVDILNEAIDRKQKVRFRYGSWKSE